MKAQLVYPSTFKNDYVPEISTKIVLVDVEAYAKGTYNGNLVIYGSNDTANGTDQTMNVTAAELANHPYYWGYPDNYYADSTGSSAGGFGGSLGRNLVPAFVHSTTNSFAVISFPPIYIGPFDKTPTAVQDVQLRCRFVTSAKDAPFGHPSPIEMAPVGFDAYFAGTGNDEQTCFTNVMVSAGNTNYAPTFLFDSANNGTIDMTQPSSTAQCPSRYELIDPRVYRYLADWTLKQGDIIAGNSSIYNGSYPDPLTGITGDDSKFTWPNAAASQTQYGSTLTKFPGSGARDPRLYQFANNINVLPGIGGFPFFPLIANRARPMVPAISPNLEHQFPGGH